MCYMDSKDPYCIYLQTFGEAANVHMDYETRDPAKWEFYVTCVNGLKHILSSIIQQKTLYQKG